MNHALTKKPVSQLAIARTLKHCHHYHLVQVAIGPPHLQIEYLWRLVACNDIIKRPVKSRPLCYCSMFVFYFCTATAIHSYTHHHHLYIPPPQATTTTQCKLHELENTTSARCKGQDSTCVRAHHITSTCPNTCCIDCCIRHSNGTRARPDLVGGMVVVVA